MISAFSFNALSIPAEPATPTTPNDLETRLAKLEALIGGVLLCPYQLYM